MSRLFKKNGFLLLILCGFTRNIYAIWDFSSTSAALNFTSTSAKLILESSIEGFSGTINTLSTESCDQIVTTTNQASILFTGGCIKNNVGFVTFSGSLITSSSAEPFIVVTNNLVDIKDSICTPLSFSGGINNRLTGSPSFDHDLVLTDSATILNIGIINKLDTNIILNGGKVSLAKDLTLKEGSIFVGDGTVDLNNFTLKLPENFNLAWSGNLTFLNASDINAKYPLTISGNWSFQGSGKKSSIYGQQTSLNLINQGSINIGDGHTLELSNVILKGLGDLQGTINIAPTGQLILTNSILDFSSNLTISSGTIIVNSEGCRVVTRGATQLIFDGSSSQLKIDGYLLQFDSLNNPGENPILFRNGASCVKLNSGDIIPGSIVSLNPNITFFQSSSIGENAISTNVALSSSKMMSFVNENHSVRKSMIFNGQNNRISFTKNDSSYVFTVDENIDLTVRNCIFDDFDPSKISLAGSNASLAKINFENNVTLKLGNNISLENFNLNITGNTLLNANNNRIGLHTTSINLTNSGSLTIANSKIQILDANPFSDISETATLTIQDSELLIQSPGCYFEKGSLAISGSVGLYGFDPASSIASSKFIFSSNKSCTIQSNSTLCIGQGAIFVNDPDCSQDNTNAQKKRHFVFSDPSAKLILSSSVFDTGSFGTAFDTGTIGIQGSCMFKIPNEDSKALELGQNLSLIVASDAIMMVDGPVQYC